MDPTIASATDRECRAALMALCDDPYIRHKTIVLLKKLRGDTSHLADNFDALAKTLKRKPEVDLVICVRCDEAFDPEDTSDATADACRFHPGDLDEDNREDQWADNDPEMELDPEEFPECFMWSCCEANYGISKHAQGCSRGRHRAWRKRGRRGTDDSSEDLHPPRLTAEKPRAAVTVGPVLSADEDEDEDEDEEEEGEGEGEEDEKELEEDADNEDDVAEETEEEDLLVAAAGDNPTTVEAQEEDIEAIYDDDRIVEVANGGVIAVVADDDDAGGEAEEMFDPEGLMPSIENGGPVADMYEEGVNGDGLAAAGIGDVVAVATDDETPGIEVADVEDGGVEPGGAAIEERQLPSGGKFVQGGVTGGPQREAELYGDEFESEVDDDYEIGVY